MEAVEVTTRFDRQGRIIPLSFIWRGREYTVLSVGRGWQDEAGQHLLVMVPGERVYELVFSTTELRWYMGRFGLDRRTV